MAIGPVDLIFCCDGCKFATIAIQYGFLFGTNLPAQACPFPIYFADQNWKKPRRQEYIEALANYRPHLATVLDLERPDQLDDVLSWSEDAAPFVNEILIIPKYSGAIASLPRSICSKPVRLAYSVPTRYGGTSVPISEFNGWPTHLLGGSHVKQIAIYGEQRVLAAAARPHAEIVSADGNYHHKVAVNYMMYWSPVPLPHCRARHWPRLYEIDGRHWDKDGIYEAFRRSCANISTAWRDALNYDYSNDFRLYFPVEYGG